jgi:hypothetical protein
MPQTVAPTTGLTCDEVEALLPLVADGAIGAEDDPDLFTHLAACPDCQADLALHDLTTLALGHGRSPVAIAADDEAVQVIHLRWPTVAGSVALAAGLAVAVWFGLRAESTIPSSLPDVQPPTTQVVEVTLDDEGNEVIVLMKDGERVEIRRIDQSDERAGGPDSGSTPVSLPHR